jgi:hypothetical protein
MTCRSARPSPSPSKKRRALGGFVALAALLLPTAGRADEPRRVSEPSVLREPAEITQVVDAFDEDDLFDLHLSLGYESSWKSADIRRETSIAQPGLTNGGFVSNALNVAHYKETTSRLNARADIGLYHDLALVVRLPVILSNERELSDGGSNALQSTTLLGVPGEQLFSVPFKSPKRSGIEYLAVGIDAAIMNQARDLTKPTWLIGIEGRFDVSEPMRACNAKATPLNRGELSSEVKCANPSDVNRNGVGGENLSPDQQPVEGTFSNADRKPGVSRGVTGLELHSYISRRIKYIEPYGGFRALFEFPSSSSDYGQTDLKGSLVNHPPLRGTMLMGVNVIPWEIRNQYQRITLDFRFTGTYVSEGRDYSELFDALGSSDANSLRAPNYADYQRNPAFDSDPSASRSIVDPNSRRVYFTGLTDVQPYGTYALSGSFTWQAGQFVKFNVGGAYHLTQGHFITFDQSCNPDFDKDVDKSGPCHSVGSGGNSASTTATGIPNPNFRKVINDPGHRFRVDDSTQVDAWINATVMF